MISASRIVFVPSFHSSLDTHDGFLRAQRTVLGLRRRLGRGYGHGAPRGARGDGTRQVHGEASRAGAMTPAHHDASIEASFLPSSDRASPRSTGARITKMRVIASARWLEHVARTTLARIPYPRYPSPVTRPDLSPPLSSSLSASLSKRHAQAAIAADEAARAAKAAKGGKKK